MPRTFFRGMLRCSATSASVGVLSRVRASLSEALRILYRRSYKWPGSLQAGAPSQHSLS